LEKQTRRDFLTKVGCGAMFASVAMATRPLTALATQQAIDSAYAIYDVYANPSTGRYPWLPQRNGPDGWRIKMLDTNPNSNWFTSYNKFPAEYQIQFNAAVTQHPYGVMDHETGHVFAFYVYNARGWERTGPADFYNEFIANQGGDPALRNRTDVDEIFAEWFARAWVPNYPGAGYPNIYNPSTGYSIMPFNATTLKTFLANSAIEADGLKFVSKDMAVLVDGNGAAIVRNVDMSATPFKPQTMVNGQWSPPILGVASRIGLVSSENLPAAYFQNQPGNVQKGDLFIKNDPVRNGNSYWRVGAFQ